MNVVVGIPEVQLGEDARLVEGQECIVYKRQSVQAVIQAVVGQSADVLLREDATDVVVGLGNSRQFGDWRQGGAQATSVAGGTPTHQQARRPVNLWVMAS